MKAHASAAASSFSPPAVASARVTAQEVGRHYDQLDRFYRGLWGVHLHHGFWRTGKETPQEAVRVLVDIVAARARIEPKMRVVDIGCGYGATARILAHERMTLVTGYTVSEAQYWFAEGQVKRDETESAHLRIVRGDWLANDLPDASQDAAIAIESVEHMADKLAVFRQAARVLRPGGRLVVCAWTAGQQLKPWHRRRLLEPIEREGKLTGVHREEDYVRWMSAAGLSVTGRDDVSKNVSRTWSICMRRLLFKLVTDPRMARFILDRSNDNRSFAMAVPRIWFAYRRGAMRYVIYTACKPPAE